MTMRRILQNRILIDIILLVGMIILPWWVTLLLALFFSFQFESYYEMIAVGLFLDAQLGFAASGFHFIFIAIFFLGFVLSYFLREKMIFYPHTYF